MKTSPAIAALLHDLQPGTFGDAVLALVHNARGERPRWAPNASPGALHGRRPRGMARHDVQHGAVGMVVQARLPPSTVDRRRHQGVATSSGARNPPRAPLDLGR